VGKNWPTKSKGVFYSGYQNVGEGPGGQERDPKHPSPRADKTMDAKGMRVHSKKEGMTKESMRHPHR